MAILNMTGGGKSVKVPLNDISTISATAGDTEATITWTDVGNLTVNGVLLNTWNATKLVRKVGSAPSDSSDGILVVTETVADTYSVNPYTDTGLTNGTTYYYKAFSVGSNGLESDSNSVNVTPAQGGWQPGADTLLYYDFEHTSGTGETDVAGNYNGTYLNTPTIGTLSSGKKYFDSGGTNYLYTTNTISDINYASVTVCVWLNPQVGNNDTAWFGQDWRGFSGATLFCFSYNNQTAYYIGGYNGDWYSTALTTNAWNYVVMVGDGPTQYTYLNGTLLGTRTISSATANKNFYIGAVKSGDSPVNSRGDAFFGSVIIEDKARTAQDVSDYYDLTKGDYGIS